MKVHGPPFVAPAVVKGSFVVMRGTRKIASAIALFGLPALFATGCAASGTASTSFTPTSLAATPVRTTATATRGILPDVKTAQWPQFGYDQGHSAYNPLEKTIDANNVSKLQVAWNDQSIVQPGGIVYDKNALYVDDMGQSNAGLYAFNGTTGTQKWYANVNLNGPWGSFTHAVSAVAGKIIVTPCSNGPGSGSQWLTGVCGVNATNGKIVWTQYCTEYQGNACPGLANGVDTSPSYDGKQIYLQMTQGVNEQPDTLALNPKDGHVVWDVAGVYHCPDGGYTGENPPPVSGGLVYGVLACQGTNGATEICAFHTSSGSSAWCDNSPTIYIEQLIADKKNLYVVEPEGSANAVLALNAMTGAQVWKATVPATNGTALAVDKAQLYVVDGGAGVYALKLSNGKQAWSYTANGNMFVGGQATVANNILYTNGGGGNNDNVAIAAFNVKNGTLIWSTSTISNGSSPASGIVVNGTVYTGCYTLCAFTLSGSMK
jgi:outer membrane protein assembly factor BamB